MKQATKTFVKTFNSNNLQQLAAYKLSHTLVKHHKPLRFGEAAVDWEKSCDKESKVFKTLQKVDKVLHAAFLKWVILFRKKTGETSDRLHVGEFRWMRVQTREALHRQ